MYFGYMKNWKSFYNIISCESFSHSLIQVIILGCTYFENDIQGDILSSLFFFLFSFGYFHILFVDLFFPYTKLIFHSVLIQVLISISCSFFPNVLMNLLITASHELFLKLNRR